MTSLKQIEANRRNALKSTGPTTPEGKQRSRCNAVRHGLTAETVIAALEDSEDYEAFEAAVISDYDAESAVERELVLRLASVLWRLRRATGIETALFESVTEDSRKHEHQLSREHLGGAADLAERKRLFLGAVQDSDAAEGNELSSNSKTDIADCFLRLADCRLAPSIASAATNIRCGGKPDRLCLRWSCCGAASERRAAQPFHSRSGHATRRLVRRIQVTTREVNVERADHCCGGSGVPSCARPTLSLSKRGSSTQRSHSSPGRHAHNHRPFWVKV